MTVLDTLNFVAFNPLKNNNPIAVRRRKLMVKIDEQIQLATNKDYTPTQHKWVTDDEGKQTKVKVTKRVKRWWTASVDGKINLVVRYGSKPLEFAKGKNAIELAGEAEVADTLRKISEAREGKNFSNSESVEQYTVEQRTLDSFKFEFDINLIKVDVEGYELEFFIGSSNTIKASSYPPIIFELWSGKSWYEQKAQKTKEILTDWGYEFSEFGREILAQHPNHPTQCKIEKNGSNINFSIV